jgi:hypothetical protein
LMAMTWARHRRASDLSTATAAAAHIASRIRTIQELRDLRTRKGVDPVILFFLGESANGCFKDTGAVALK